MQLSCRLLLRDLICLTIWEAPDVARDFSEHSGPVIFSGQVSDSFCRTEMAGGWLVVIATYQFDSLRGGHALLPLFVVRDIGEGEIVQNVTVKFAVS